MRGGNSGLVEKIERNPWRGQALGQALLNIISEADFYRLPELELRGGNLLTDGCRRVLDFTPQRICLDMGDTLVTLYGADLRIESFAGKRLIAAGRFARIELRSKWEVPQE